MHIVWVSSLRGPKRRSPASSLSSGSDTAAWNKQIPYIHIYSYKFSGKKEYIFGLLTKKFRFSLLNSNNKAEIWKSHILVIFHLTSCMKKIFEMEYTSFTSSLNTVSVQRHAGDRGGRAEYRLLPSPALFPSWSVGVSFKDDVTVYTPSLLLLLGSLAIEKYHGVDQRKRCY